MENLLKPEKTIGRAIDEATVRECILKNAATVTDWAANRLVRKTTGAGIIPELYADYESYCRREKRPPLPRKVWIAALKLAGFKTQSGVFAGLAIR